MDEGHWLGSLLWHGWLPLLSGTDGASPWAESAAQGAGLVLEQVLGAYSSGLFLIRSLVSPLRVLGSILTILGIDGVLLGGVISMILVL